MFKSNFALIFLLLFTFISCGGDDGDSTTVTVPPPQQEEDPTPPTPTPQPGKDCMSNRQRANITTLMNRLADFSTITGRGAIGVINPQPNGPILIVNIVGGADIEKLSDTSWNVVHNYCRTDDPTACATLADGYAIVNDCLELRGQEVKILSSSSTTLRISRPEQDGTLESSLNSRGDKFRYSVRGRRDGRTESLLIFEED